MWNKKHCLKFKALLPAGLGVISLFTLVVHFPGGEARQNLPKLTIVKLGTFWNNITVPDIHQTVLYSPKFGSDFVVKCKANYPIQWIFTGVLFPADIVRIFPPKRNLVEGTFEIKVAIAFLDSVGNLESMTSVKLSCEKIGDPKLHEKLFVFVQGGNKNSFIESHSRVLRDTKVLPCATTDPRVMPVLFQKLGERRKEPVEDPSLKYSYVEGFRSNKTFDGAYECRQGSSSIIITAEKTNTSLIPNEYQYTPISNLIRVFSDTTIKLGCFSGNQRSTEIVVNAPTQKVTIVNTITNDGIITIVSSKYPSTRVINGTAVCKATDEVLHTWNYEFVPTPKLYLDNYSGDVHCISNPQLQPRMIQTVRCRNKMHCNFMSHCFENTTQCNFKKQKQFFSGKSTYCNLPKLKRGGHCNSVPYSHLNGLVQCKSSGLVKQWEYFVSLDFLKYSNWREVPMAQLVRMDETDPILYTNRTTQFICVALAYLFADSISFEIEYQNGTRHRLEGNGNTVNISNPMENNDRKIDELNILGILDIKLPLEAVVIHCHAPWWNATDTMTTSRKFKTQHLLEPMFTDGNSSVKQESFYTGVKNQRLVCPVIGQPQPKYSWLFNDGNITHAFPELQTSVGSNGEGYMHFPELSGLSNNWKMYSGEFKCVAENDLGRVERRYVVNVEDIPLSGKTVIYIVSVVVILAVLAVVVALLCCSMKRYKKAQELVRNLTDSEINEFFEGRPELLNNTVGNELQVVDFLPYDTKFEIPLEDLKFDTSEQNFLGSGNFSYVVRGIILSKNKPVAIKIFKTTADVTLFKSLLSEVKIMIHIGKHENVISLIGVCTSGIKNRVIYIATEICELGSLIVFLRQARPTFVDLMNANQELDMSLLETAVKEQRTSDSVITTLDLISFSGQIAKGMEYLSYKSVIHADLAARNVLLTKNKVIKICDFGLSKKLYESDNYVKKSGTPLPWRWMSIEALNTLTFSYASDIWAYGVTLFEIFTLGDIPFPNIQWNREFVAQLASGMRMGRPKYSTSKIYSKIVACWENEPSNRPSFSILREYFDRLGAKYQIMSANITTLIWPLLLLSIAMPCQMLIKYKQRLVNKYMLTVDKFKVDAF